MTRDEGQRTFAVILGEAEDEERFRTTVMACDREQAIEKAALLAERLNVEVELVMPAENLPPRPIRGGGEGGGGRGTGAGIGPGGIGPGSGTGTGC